MRILAAALLIVALIYGWTELKRWRAPEMRDLLTRAQRVRRVLNFFALFLVVAMAFGGTFLPSTHMTKRMAVIELAYWSVCMLVAVLVPLGAVWEYRVTLRSTKMRELEAERNDAMRRVVDSVAVAEEKRRRREELPHRNGHG